MRLLNIAANLRAHTRCVLFAVASTVTLPQFFAVLVLLGFAVPVSADDALLVPEARVSRIKIQPDKAPDCTSLKSIVESVTRNCKTNDEKAIAIYNFMQLSHYHRNYPSERGGIPALKEINTYGWSLCGGLHSVQSALWRELGWKWRFVGWDGHTTVEAQYDNGWHYLDVFLKFYAWKPDSSAPGGRTIASQDDLTRDPQGLILDAFVMDDGRGVAYAKDDRFEINRGKANWTAPALLCCGDTIRGLIEGLKTHHGAGSPEGWGSIEHATGSYSADVDLAPGYSLTNAWEAVDDGWYWSGSKIAPQHTCGNKDLRNNASVGLVLEPYFQHVRGYADGTLLFAPDFGSDACLKSFAATNNVGYANGMLTPKDPESPASVTVLLSSPYIMTKATSVAAGASSLEISVDNGTTFRKAEFADFTGAVKGHVAALARISFTKALTSLRLEATVQNNPGSLPYLSPGNNVIHVSVAEPAALGDNKLVVTYAYAPGFRTKSFDQLCLEGKEIAKQHNAFWAQAPTVVQKSFAAQDLPATFEINVTTPKGEFPVYPRMLFVRREIVAPGSKPLPLPKDAQEPAAAGPQDELASLPDPFLIGSQPPPPREVRPLKTTKLALRPGHFVAKSGQVLTSDFIKWPKAAAEEDTVPAIVYLIGGEAKDLPAQEDLAAVRLVFPLVAAHEHAPTKVGAVALCAPFEVDVKYDFANLGDVLGSVVVPQFDKPGTPWSPAKEFKIDVTKLFRSVISGDAEFHGLGLRVLPDRAIDDGYTVRVNIPKSPKIYLEIDTYHGAATTQ